MKRTKADWRREVFKSTDPHMTGSVKVLCLYLADHMKADLKVSIPREVIAAALGVHPQRVAERLKKATEASYLTHTLTGRPGRTAEYQGIWPEVKKGGRPRHGGVPRTAPQDALRTAPQGAFENTPKAVRTPDPLPAPEQGTAYRSVGRQLEPDGPEPAQRPRALGLVNASSNERGVG